MKIAVFGTTLHAGVMSALLAEYGNQIYWCTSVTVRKIYLYFHIKIKKLIII